MTHSHGTSAFRRAADRLLEMPLVYRSWQAPFASAKLQPFLDRVDLTRRPRVLDIGCGPGTNAPVFSNCEYVGIDINAEYIRVASSKYRGRWLVGDVTDDRVLPDEQFDCVFANSLMHHLDDDAVRNLLRRMARLTAPGGRVHVLDLVLPPHLSAGRLLARLDRGRFARPVEQWRAMLTEHLREDHFQPYAFGLPFVPLWQMIYFVGAK